MKYWIDGKLEMSGFRRQNKQNFQFFKGPFLRNEWPYGYDFWRFLKTNVRLLKI